MSPQLARKASVLLTCLLGSERAVAYKQATIPLVRVQRDQLGVVRYMDSQDHSSNQGQLGAI